MTVALHWITPDAERVIVDCARVSSNPDAAKRPDSDLLRYLIRNAHWSPLEMASACVEIHTTRDIGRQILRHRSLSFQEFSQRYQDVSILPPAQYRECRMQHPTNRQASLACEGDALRGWWAEQQAEVWGTAMAAYRDALARGVAKEVARAVLPEGLTASRMFATGTIRSWVHFVAVRDHEAAQSEVQQVAREIRTLLSEHIPTVMEAAA